MKNIIKMTLAAAVLGITASCTDLDVDVKSKYTEYPNDPVAIEGKMSDVYYSFRQALGNNYNRVQTFSSDEATGVSFGTDYFDKGENIHPSIHNFMSGDDPAEFVSKNNSKFQSVLGFHGMEFVLFRNGKNRTVEALKANDTEEEMTSVKGIDELAFLQAVAADVKNITALLEFTWMGSAASNETKSVLSNASYVFTSLRYNGLAANGTMCYGQHLLSPSATTGYHSWQGTMNQIFIGGCDNICAEVADQKLGQAYRVATGNAGVTEDGERESIDYIESPYSHRSFIDYQDNIYSIKNTLYGTRDVNATSPAENSMMNLLKKMNYSGLNDLSTALNNAIQTLETAKNSGKSFVEEPGAQRVKDCIDAVSNLSDELKKAATWINLQDAI